MSPANAGRPEASDAERAGSPPRPTIGRGEKVRAAVLEATRDELAAVGYAALTMDNVAKRAGVHKTTVYRRWADREALVLDALATIASADIPIPDTGAIDTDLQALARSLVGLLNEQALRGVEMPASVPGAVEIRRRYRADQLRRIAPVIQRAVERGEFPPGTDAQELLMTASALILFRYEIAREPINDSTADQAARVAAAAARAGVFVV